MCIAFSAPVRSTAQDRSSLQEDTVKVRAKVMQQKQERDSKLLPRFHNDRDSAGFQLIPRIDSYNVIREPDQDVRIYVSPADSVKRQRPAHPDSTKNNRKK
jgi:hypothetical protein